MLALGGFHSNFGKTFELFRWLTRGARTGDLHLDDIRPVTLAGVSDLHTKAQPLAGTYFVRKVRSLQAKLAQDMPKPCTSDSMATAHAPSKTAEQV